MLLNHDAVETPTGLMYTTYCLFTFSLEKLKITFSLEKLKIDLQEIKFLKICHFQLKYTGLKRI